jgi:hypothetical protein
MAQATVQLGVKFAWWYLWWLRLLTLWAVIVDRPVSMRLVNWGHKRGLRVKVE